MAVFAERCAAHPSRPAVGACPTCGRSRCGADAERFGDGCSLCGGRAIAPVARPPTVLERLVRAALAATPITLLGGAVSSEYVQTRWFSLLVPLIVGIACGGVAAAAARRASAGTRVAVRLVAVGYALLGVAYGFRFDVGRVSPFSPAHRVLPPYAAAAVGVWVWDLLLGPPRRGPIPVRRRVRGPGVARSVPRRAVRSSSWIRRR